MTEGFLTSQSGQRALASMCSPHWVILTSRKPSSVLTSSTLSRSSGDGCLTRQCTAKNEQGRACAKGHFCERCSPDWGSRMTFGALLCMAAAKALAGQHFWCPARACVLRRAAQGVSGVPYRVGTPQTASLTSPDSQYHVDLAESSIAPKHSLTRSVVDSGQIDQAVLTSSLTVAG